MDTDMKQILEAIDILYHGNQTTVNAENVKQASIYLTNFQKTIHAWKVADQLLHMKRDFESCFFAAQTLKTKIQYFFGELPAEAQSSFKVSMFEHLTHITDDTKQGISTQLCVATADLALLMVSWEDPVGDLLTAFGPSNGQANLAPLLEVLIALPEELLPKNHLPLGLHRRNRLEKYLETQVLKIIELLDNLVRQVHAGKCDGSIHLKAVRCLSSWFSIKTPDWKKLAETCLLVDVLNIISNPQVNSRLHEVATDCACSAMFMLENGRLPELSSILFAGILQLETSYQMAVALENINGVANYARLFTELGETLITVMVKPPDEYKEGTDQVLHLLITTVGHHEWEVAEITFNFWSRFSEILFKRNLKDYDAFKPYIERLIKALYRHCQIDSDHQGILSTDDDFYKFRERVNELIKDVVFIIESKNCFVQMADQLLESAKNWSNLEAALFIMQSVARCLLPQENEVVPPIVEEVLNQTDSVHVQVTYTSIMLLKELGEWLIFHKDVIHKVLEFLTKHLYNPDLATISAIALHTICDTCINYMEPHFDAFMSLATTMDSFNLNNDAAVGLLKSLSRMLEQLPHDQLVENMKKICGFQCKHLDALVQGNAPLAKNTKTDPVTWLTRLSAIFRSVRPIVSIDAPHPCQEVVVGVWPHLLGVFQKYHNNVRVMEHCCRCLRFAIRMVNQQSAPLLSSIVETIVGLYTQNGFSCFLYLGSILVDVYGKEQGCTEGLLNMLTAFAQPTFALLSEANGFQNHPDTVDDWFRLCGRFIQTAPIPFLHSASIELILQCGVQGSLLDHKDANAAVLNFFQDLLDLAIKKSDRADFEERQRLVNAVLDSHGQSIVNNLVTSAIFILPNYMIHEVASTMLVFMTVDRPRFCVLLENKLKEMPRTNSGGIEAVTPEQVVELHKNITMAERSNDVYQALVIFKRYFT